MLFMNHNLYYIVNLELVILNPGKSYNNDISKLRLDFPEPTFYINFIDCCSHYTIRVTKMHFELLDKVYYGNTLMDYMISLGIFILSLLVIFIVKNVIIRKLKLIAQKTSTSIDNLIVELIEKKIVPFLYLGTFYFSMQGLKMAPAVQKVFTVSVSLLLTILIVRAVSVLLSVILEQRWASSDKNASRKNAFRSLLTGIQIVMWAIAVVMLLDNFGVNISTLVTGLGIGGIAIAIASQAVLGDLFSYFTIIFDRPFEIGDFIIVGDRMGTVEHIGMKSTRVRSLSGEQLVFRNTDLTDSRISNYKRMENRRVVFSIGVTYDTDIALLKEIPLKIKSIIESIPLTKFDRSHFFSFGNYSLTIETVYYVASSDYNVYMNIHQDINFRIMEEFKSMGVKFAFPTQTLHIVPDKSSSSLLSAS